jgi:hypothetical protein
MVWSSRTYAVRIRARRLENHIDASTQTSVAWKRDERSKGEGLEVEEGNRRIDQESKKKKSE